MTDPYIVLRRIDRFFGDEGICAHYEARNDPLIAVAELAGYLVGAVSGLSRLAAIERIVWSAKNGGFGRHASGRVGRLVDLDGVQSAAAGSYRLRPNILRVEAEAKLMRARRAVWAEWLTMQSWPIPPEWQNAIPPAAAYRTGGPGKPSSKHLVELELRRRAATGKMLPKLSEEAETLAAWLCKEHPTAPPMIAKTIRNGLRELHRSLKEQRPEIKISG